MNAGSPLLFPPLIERVRVRPMARPESQPSILWIPAFALWLGALIFGFYQLSQYEYTSSRALQATASWPTESSLTLSSKGSTLLVFLHPHCPCSQATLSELERQQRYWPKSLHLTFVFIQSPKQSREWVQGALWDRAGRFAKSQRRIDRNGREAFLFGASNSGEAHLFDSSGRSLFVGGVTSSRGHEGVSLPGRDLLARIENEIATPCEHPVFGCELFASQDLKKLTPCCETE